MDKKTEEKLKAKLPEWALKPHPSKKGSDKKPMTVINPMAVIDRLNEVFGVGAWQFRTTYISCDKEIQQVKDYQNEGKMKDRTVYISTVHASLSIPDQGIYIEQFGGSTNDDAGDALKGGATDALTKIASYLGVGASIYKGQGNVEPPKNLSLDEAFALMKTATTNDELSKIYKSLPAHLLKDPEIIALGVELRNELID